MKDIMLSIKGVLYERGVLLRPEANELRTGFADHTQTEEGTEQVQPRDQEVSKQRTDNFRQESQNKNTQGKDDEAFEIHGEGRLY